MQVFDTPSGEMQNNPAGDYVLLVYSAGGPRSTTDAL